MRKRISYDIRFDMPSWPGDPTFSVQRCASLRAGDVANTYILHLFNHYGTHIDAPNHALADGVKITEIPFERFFYERPLLLDIPKGDREKVTTGDLVPFCEQIAQCDLLMVRTGYATIRESEPARFKTIGPAIGSDAAKYLSEHFAGTLKAVAVDFLSLASPSDAPDGHLAHDYLLGKYAEDYICILEDVNMRDLPADKICSAAAIPLFPEQVDSSPVTMWVELEE